MGRSTRGMMWMGTRNYERWVPAAKVNADFSSVGNRDQDQYLNGGAGVRGVKDGHKEYNLTWSSKRREALAPVLDLAKGLYDEGLDNDLIYFVDPTVYDWNILPDMLAAPYKTGVSGVPLTNDTNGYPVYPSIDASPRNSYGYPARSATYTVSASTVPAPPLYIPIPPGKTLWLGVHGTAAGARLMVTPFNGPAALTPVAATLLPSDTDQRVNMSWSNADGVSGVEIALGATAGTITLQGLIGQILDDSIVPFPGDFISGEGNSGCEFANIPTLSPYLNGKLWGMAAKLVEVGAWQ